MTTTGRAVYGKLPPVFTLCTTQLDRARPSHRGRPARELNIQTISGICFCASCPVLPPTHMPDTTSSGDGGAGGFDMAARHEGHRGCDGDEEPPDAGVGGQPVGSEKEVPKQEELLRAMSVRALEQATCGHNDRRRREPMRGSLAAALAVAVDYPAAPARRAPSTRRSRSVAAPFFGGSAPVDSVARGECGCRPSSFRHRASPEEAPLCADHGCRGRGPQRRGDHLQARICAGGGRPRVGGCGPTSLLLQTC